MGMLTLPERGETGKEASPPREQSKPEKGQICLLMFRHAPGIRIGGLWSYSFKEDSDWPAKTEGR